MFWRKFWWWYKKAACDLVNKRSRGSRFPSAWQNKSLSWRQGAQKRPNLNSLWNTPHHKTNNFIVARFHLYITRRLIQVLKVIRKGWPRLQHMSHDISPERAKKADSYGDASPGISRAIWSLLRTCSLMYEIPLIYVSVNLYYFRILYKGQVLHVLCLISKRGFGIIYIIAIQIALVTIVNSSDLSICISDVFLIEVCFKRIWAYCNALPFKYIQTLEFWRVIDERGICLMPLIRHFIFHLNYGFTRNLLHEKPNLIMGAISLRDHFQRTLTDTFSDRGRFNYQK